MLNHNSETTCDVFFMEKYCYPCFTFQFQTGLVGKFMVPMSLLTAVENFMQSQTRRIASNQA